MSKVIDFDRGIKTEVVTNEDGTTTTKYSIKPIEAKNYCPEHEGVVNVDGTIYAWHEDCECNHA